MARGTQTRITPPEGVAGSLGTFALEVTLGDERIGAGGGVRVAPFKRVANYWVPVQDGYPARENHVAVRATAGATVALTVESRGWGLTATVLAGELAPGDTVTFVLGDGSGGSPGLRLGPLAGQAELRIHVKSAPDAPEREVRPIFFEVRPGQPHELRVRARRETGGAALLRAALVDGFGNTVRDAPGTLSLEPVRGLEAPGSLAFPPRGKALCEAEVRGAAGRIRAAVPDFNLETKTDPLPSEDRIFWGDLHCHTRIAQALETPEFLYEYARYDAALDFVCHVEHYSGGDVSRWAMDGWRRLPSTPADLRAYIRDAWAYQREAVRQHHEPGQFVAFLGYEWGHFVHGDVHVILAADEGEVIFPISFWSKTDTPQSLFARLADTEALVIPHHSSYPVSNGELMGGWDWRNCDPRLMRLVEICSKHGVSEYLGCADGLIPQAAEGTVQAGLALGHRLGFVGSTDTHATRPGSWGIPGDLAAPRGGLAAVFAPVLDRASIFRALQDRRCYATTGARMILGFTVNGRPMGSELTLDPAADRHIVGSVAGTAPIRSVEVVRRNAVVFRSQPHRPAETASIDCLDHVRLGGETFCMRLASEGGSVTRRGRGRRG